MNNSKPIMRTDQVIFQRIFQDNLIQINFKKENKRTKLHKKVIKWTMKNLKKWHPKKLFKSLNYKKSFRVRANKISIFNHLML